MHRHDLNCKYDIPTALIYSFPNNKKKSYHVFENI
jgi:hypothetical protein